MKFTETHPLKPTKVPLDGEPSLQKVNYTMQLGAISKLTEGALNSSVHANSKDVLCKGFWTPETKVTQAEHSKPLNKEAHGLVEAIFEWTHEWALLFLANFSKQQCKSNSIPDHLSVLTWADDFYPFIWYSHFILTSAFYPALKPSAYFIMDTMISSVWDTSYLCST